MIMFLGAILCSPAPPCGDMQFILVASSAVMAVLGFCYLRAAKPYVPFASAQLTVGVAALRESLVWVMLVAYGALVVSLAWAAVGSLAIYGLMDHYHRQGTVGCGSMG